MSVKKTTLRSRFCFVRENMTRVKNQKGKKDFSTNAFALEIATTGVRLQPEFVFLAHLGP